MAGEVVKSRGAVMYSIITQIIIFFAMLRRMVQFRTGTHILKNRTFIQPSSCIIECCDCGLSHLCWTADNGKKQLAQPLRPGSYDYKLRYFSSVSSDVVRQDELPKSWQDDKWGH